MFNIKMASIILLVLALTGCVAYKTRVGVTEAMILTNSLNHIIHKAEIKVDGGEWKETSKKGTSFPIGDGLQVGLSHCDVQNFVIIRTQFGVYKQDIEVRNRSYWIGKVEIELVARLGDISIYKKPYEADNPFTLGVDPDVGVELLIIGDSFLDGNNWKTGIVSMLEISERWIERDDDLNYCFLHTVPLNPGDSGSPVLAKRGHLYEVVGIANAGAMQAQLYNFAIRVSRIKETIKLIGDKK